MAVVGSIRFRQPAARRMAPFGGLTSTAQVGTMNGDQRQLSQTRRLRLRFSMKSLLVGVAVVAALLAGVRLVLRDYFTQGAAIRTLISRYDARPDTRGSGFGRDVVVLWLGCSRTKGNLPPKARRKDVDDSALRYVGKLRHLEYLNLCFTNVRGDGLRDLGELAHLSGMDLAYSRITDVTIKNLPLNLPLEYLGLRKTEIGDAGVAHIAKLPRLARLDLRETRITDSALQSLSSARSLTMLDLRDTAVTDAGLRYLKSLHKLKELRLAGTQVTDTGVRGLRQRFGLKILDLSNTKITNATVANLASLYKLEELYLEDTAIDDDCMDSFLKYRGLKRASVRWTRVTREKRQEVVKRSASGLRIAWGDWPPKPGRTGFQQAPKPRTPRRPLTPEEREADMDRRLGI